MIPVHNRQTGSGYTQQAYLWYNKSEKVGVPVGLNEKFNFFMVGT